MQAMCEPFLPFIVKALNYGREDLTLVAFKVTQRMLKLPLPGRIEMAKSLSDTMLNLLSHGSNAISNTGVAETEYNLSITCLRSAAVLLSEVGTKNFTVVSRERVEALITISCELIDSGGPEMRGAALSVLRSLVAGQVIIPKLYDAIEKVKHLAIHCQSRQLRDACTNLSITFLVSFPLGSKRVCQHLELFVRNLSYELAAGRLAALNAIHAVLNKFPGDVLERETPDSSETKEPAPHSPEELCADGNDTSSDGITGGGLRMMGQTLQESLSEVLGTTEYFEVYNQLRSLRGEMKQARKRNEALLAAVHRGRTAKKCSEKVAVREWSWGKLNKARRNADSIIFYNNKLWQED
ncbi:hypothetical protein FGB62_14g019 [Gracilaria domingensis]|nr:hypothetical protein FGB62_14g019 [Gracilaria domingensis]